MGIRIAPKAGWVQGWVGLATLVLAFACFSALAVSPGSGPAPSRPVTEATTVRVEAPDGATARKGIQTQAADDETGREGQSRIDLAPAPPVCVQPPGGRSRAVLRPGPSPVFPPGCDREDGHPRPPPGRSA